MPSLPPPRILLVPIPDPVAFSVPWGSCQGSCALDLQTQNRTDSRGEEMSEGQVICSEALEIHRFFLFHQLL